MGLREGRGPIANAIGIAAGITIGGVIVKASPLPGDQPPFPPSRSPAARRDPSWRSPLPPASPPTEQRMHSTGGDVARLNFPRLPLSSRRKTIEVTLGEGQTVGELVCKYVGEYTEENLRVALDMNKDRIDDVDFVQPGTVIRLPDNRRPKLATPEAEWWDGRGMGAAAREAPEGATGASEPGIAPADNNRVPAKDANNSANARRRRETPPEGGEEKAAQGGMGASAKAKAKSPPPGKLRVNPDGVDMRSPDAPGSTAAFR